MRSDRFFFSTAVFERLAGGFTFCEGPVWSEKEARLYFTDFPNDRIYRWDAKHGTVLYTDSSERAIGLALDAAERLISCESRRHRIAVVNEKESFLLADQYQGKSLNSPNDVIVSRDGKIYFTDPYSSALSRPNEQGFQGVYRFNTAGEVQLVTKEIKRPNGLALSRDESILYVNDTDENRIYQFTYNHESEALYGTKRCFAQLDAAYGAGACDGMKVDRYGHVWVTGPAGLWIFDPAGACLAILDCPEYVGNFCFGGKAGNELFITASTSVYRLRLAQRVMNTKHS